MSGPSIRKRKTKAAGSSGFTIQKLLVGSLVVGLLAAMYFALVADLPPEASTFKMSIGAFFIGGGMIMSLVAGLMILINAFRESTMWGLGFFIPIIGAFVSLAFIVKHWSENGRLFLTNLGGTILTFTGTVVVGMSVFDGLSRNFSNELAESSSNSSLSSTADVAVRQTALAISNDNAGALWDALPRSYQIDINSLVHDYANAVDPKIWDRNFALIRRLASVMDAKKEYIFKSPMFASLPDKDVVVKNFDSAINLMNVVLKSDLSDLDKLKTLDLGDYLDTTGSQMLGEISRLIDATPGGAESNPIRNLAKMSVSMVRSDDSTATLKITIPGQEQQQSVWVKTDGQWIPKSMAEEWPGMITEARQSVAMMKSDPSMSAMQASMMFGMAEGMLAPFENANSQAEFDAALQGVMGGMMGGGLAGPGRPGVSSFHNTTPEVEDNILKNQHQGALAGRRISQYDYGMRFLHGNGVEQDVEMARHWLTLAAKQGHTKAKTTLAELEQQTKAANN